MPNESIPYVNPEGHMIIPFDSDAKYHYWNGGQPLTETMTELNVTKDIWDKHTVKPYPENAA
jgi:hypothetical protein